MLSKKRVVSSSVVLAAAIVACVAGPKLSTTSQAVITVSPSSYTFPPTPIGQTATSTPFTIAPQGSADDDNVTAIIESCAEFQVQHPPLPQRVYSDCTAMFAGDTYGGNCIPITFDFTATFTPNSSFPSSCSVQIHYEDIASGSGSAVETITLSGSGSAPQAAMSVSPTSINFGDVTVGATSSSQPVTVKNVGSAALTLSGSLSNPSVFLVSGASLAPHTLAPGAQETYSVACQPTSASFHMGALSFTTSEGPTGQVTLGCSGTTSQLSVTPSPASFAATLVGRPPPDVTLTISNGGSSGTPTTINSVTLAPSSSAELMILNNPQGTTLGPGSAAQVTLRYTAASRHPLGELGTLTISHTAGDDRSVTVQGEALEGSVGTTPPEVDFGPLCVGESRSRDLMVYASSEGNVQLLSVTPPAAPFTVAATPGTLQGNHASELPVEVSVTATAPGILDDKLVLTTDVPGKPTHEVPVKATAIPAGVAPTPERTHFGPGRVGQISSAKSIVISNCRSTPAQITSARIDGLSAAEFAIVSPADTNVAIPAMGALEFLVVMTPQTNGVKDAQLVLEHDGGTTIAFLDGNGFGGEGGPEKLRETYYACSTGRGTTLWPLALALLVVLRRRRIRYGVRSI